MPTESESVTFSSKSHYIGGLNCVCNTCLNFMLLLFSRGRPIRAVRQWAATTTITTTTVPFTITAGSRRAATVSRAPWPTATRPTRRRSPRFSRSRGAQWRGTDPCQVTTGISASQGGGYAVPKRKADFEFELICSPSGFYVYFWVQKIDSLFPVMYKYIPDWEQNDSNSKSTTCTFL